MRIAVFSDVHGNLTALEAVLADISSQAVDTAVFAGDLCVLGPRPAECVALLRDSKTLSIYGNTDNWLLNRQKPPERLRAMAEWSRDQLGPAQRRWLKTLPFEKRFDPSADPADSLLVVHANPLDVNQLIFPPVDDQESRYGRVVQSDEDLDPLLAGTQAAVLAFGHLHVPSIRSHGTMRLVNISSVSIPGDGDGRAKYGLFTWSGTTWTFERRFVPYETDRELQAYLDRQPPRWEELAQQVRSVGYVAQVISV